MMKTNFVNEKCKQLFTNSLALSLVTKTFNYFTYYGFLLVCLFVCLHIEILADSKFFKCLLTIKRVIVIVVVVGPIVRLWDLGL